MNQNRILLTVGIGGVLGAILVASPQASPPPKVEKAKIDYQRDIAPLFQTRCYSCHGPAQQTNGLRLDVRAAAMAGGVSGAPIKPGKSAESRLIQLVSGTGKIVMPPVGPRLSEEQVSLLRAWIDEGASWPETELPAQAGTSAKSAHWAFQPVRPPDLPTVRKRHWVRNPVDAFVLSRLESEGIDPSPEADRYTLIRRLSLDLIGTPPTPQEISDFIQDNRPSSYERLLDRLLASPHYGEKWARHWLDLARYADSDGYETDQLRPYAWRYRDWVIDALNRNVPYDQFTIEQLAGDLLPDASVEQKVATGFNRNTLSNREGGADPEEYRVEQVVDRISTMGTVWLGMTVGCARCHNHKYDPISQKEFYQLYAFFNNADEINIAAPTPGEVGQYLRGRPEYDKKRREILCDLEKQLAPQQTAWEKKIKEAVANPGKDYHWDRQWELLGLIWEGGKGGGQLEGRFIFDTDPAKRTETQKERLFEYFLREGELIDPQRFKELNIKDVIKKLDDLEKTYGGLTQAPTFFENPHPRTSYVHLRGDFRSKGIDVEPALPAVFAVPPSDTKSSRLTFARWLVSKQNPLTARVAVNRLWQELFGAGIVLTSEDFGTHGARPTHAELLDWLASEYMDGGWDTKQMIRLIVTSATYRQSSRIRKELEVRDPANTLLARQSRVRLPAELIRDSSLAVSGLLSNTVGGPSVHPPQPESVTKQAFETPWVESTGPDRYRRGLYIWLQRTAPYAQLINFDAPDPVRTCSRRERSDTPLQALNLLNDPVFFEAAQSLAMRILSEKNGGTADRIRYGFELCTSRPPDSEEIQRLTLYFNRQRDSLKSEPDAVPAMFPNRVDGTDPVDAAAWTGLSSVLLNLDEFITRE
jgi:mono/diheme cytochrome c family protein